MSWQSPSILLCIKTTVNDFNYKDLTDLYSSILEGKVREGGEYCF